MTPNPIETASTGVFEKARTFHATRESVWRAWSERDSFAQWWGPKGCHLELLRFEFRPGGFIHHSMQFPASPISWGRFNFREIVEHEALTWLNSFANANCGIARAPFSERCPLEILNTVHFSEHGGHTTVLLRAEPFGATADEQTYFEDLCSSGSLDEGYGGTFDALEAHLTKGVVPPKALPKGSE